MTDSSLCVLKLILEDLSVKSRKMGGRSNGCMAGIVSDEWGTRAVGSHHGDSLLTTEGRQSCMIKIAALHDHSTPLSLSVGVSSIAENE
jgi:hypothetical protein